jgi:hypothetical protein
MIARLAAVFGQQAGRAVLLQAAQQTEYLTTTPTDQHTAIGQP